MALLAATLREIPTVEMKESLRQSEEVLRRRSKEAQKLKLNSFEKRAIRQSIRDLRRLQNLSDRELEEELHSTAREVCLNSRRTAKSTLRFLATGLTTLGHVLLLPLKAAVRFTQGALTGREARPPTDQGKGPSFSKLTGDKGGIATWSGVAIQSIRALFTAINPLSLGVLAAQAVDTETEAFCDSPNEKTPEEIKFCERYQKLRKKMYTISVEGRSLGVQFHDDLLVKFDERSDLVLDPEICTLGLTEQFHRGHRAARRFRQKAEFLRLSKSEQDRWAIFPYFEDTKSCVVLRLIHFPLEADSKGAPPLPPTFDPTPHLFVDGIVVQHLSAEEFEAEQKSLEKTQKEREKTWAELDVQARKKHTLQELQNSDLLCADLLRSKLQRKVRDTNDGAYAGILQSMEVLLNPGRHTKLTRNFSETPIRTLRQPEAPAKIGNKNLVVILGTPPSEVLPDLRANEAILKKTKEELDVERKNLKLLFQSETHAQCVSRLKNEMPKVLRLYELHEKVQELQKTQRLFEEWKVYQTNAKQIRRSRFWGRTKMPWEVIYTRTFEDLQQILRDPELLNLVVVGHGNQAGRLLDDLGNVLPYNFFEEVPPSLLSLNLYLCHAEDALGVSKTTAARILGDPSLSGNGLGKKLSQADLHPGYGIFQRDWIERHPSFHPIRHFGTARSAGLLEGGSAGALALALPSFVQEVDEVVSKLYRGSVRAQSTLGHQLQKFQAPKLCKIQVVGAELEQGGVAIRFAPYPVGFLYDSQRSPQRTFYYPCEWDVPGKAPKISIENIHFDRFPFQSSRPPVFKNPESIQVKLERSDGSIHTESQPADPDRSMGETYPPASRSLIFWRKDRSTIQSMRFGFEALPSSP
jgi:hypothetical protein